MSERHNAEEKFQSRPSWVTIFVEKKIITDMLLSCQIEITGIVSTSSFDLMSPGGNSFNASSTGWLVYNAA